MIMKWVIYSETLKDACGSSKKCFLSDVIEGATEFVK